MISITRRFEFSYAHCLKGHEGKCKNLHGHNAILEVEVEPYLLGFKCSFDKQQKPDHNIPLKEAMVMDFGDLSKVVKEHVIEFLDHHNLNDLFPFHPTAENMCLWIAQTLQREIGQVVRRVRVWETSNCYAEWKHGGSI